MNETMMTLQDGSRVRAVDLATRQRDIDVAAWQLNIDLPTTGLVLGQPRLRQMLGSAICRPVSVEGIHFKYLTFGKEAFDLKLAERALRAPFQYSDRKPSTVSATLARYGWAALADRDEFTNSDAASSMLGIPYNQRMIYASLARQLVELAVEKKRADLILAAGSYSSSPDLDDDATGSEWNAAGGDSRTQIRALASALAAANGVQIEDIDVFLSMGAYEAAQDDPTLLGKRQYTGLATIDTAVLREYWGVRSVTVGDAWYSSDGSTMTSMYGDIAVLKVAVPLASYDTREGQLDSFVRFTWARGGGVAAMPYYIEERTSLAFPWEAWELADQVGTATCAIERNVKA